MWHDNSILVGCCITPLQKCFNLTQPSCMQFPGTCREERKKNVTYKALLSLLAYWAFSLGFSKWNKKSVQIEMRYPVNNIPWLVVNDHFRISSVEGFYKQSQTCFFVDDVPFFSFRFGRKKIVFISLAAQCASVLLQSFSYSWRMFCIMFLFVGASQVSIYMSAFVLGMNCKPLLILC